MIENYSLSEKQAQAILDMRLQRLTGLERDKIENEYQALLETIKDLEDILANEPRIFNIIKEEHIALKEKYADKRRSEIGQEVNAVDMEDLIPNEQVAIVMSKKGFIKRMPITNFKNQLRGGRGINSMTMRDEDLIEQMFVASTHDHLLCFTTKGLVYRLKVYQLPEASRQSKGSSIAHLINLDEGESITALIPIQNFDVDEYLFMTTQKGIVKKSAIRDFINLKNRSMIAIKLDDNDTLNWVQKSNGQQEILLVTSAAMVIRFKESDVRPMGRATRGIKGITIKAEDSLVSMNVIDSTQDSLFLLLITTYGYGKKY